MNKDDRKFAPHALRRLLGGLNIPESLAAELATINLNAGALRALPDTILAGELRSEAEKLLGEHLPRLLRAYGDARRAAPTDLTAGADAFARGLGHIGSELARIGKACRDDADTSLSTEARFLELRYPSEFKRTETTKPINGGAVQLKSSTIEHLVAGHLDSPAILSPPYEKTRWPFPKIALPSLGPNSLGAAIAVVLLAVAAMAIMGAVSRGQHENHAARAAAELNRTLHPAIVNARIFRGEQSGRLSYGNKIVGAYGATVAFNGHVENPAGVPIEQLSFTVTLFDCPTRSTPWSGCFKLDEASATTSVPDTRRGEAAKFDGKTTLEAPTSSRVMRAKIRFADAQLAPDALDRWYHDRKRSEAK